MRREIDVIVSTPVGDAIYQNVPSLRCLAIPVANSCTAFSRDCGVNLPRTGSDSSFSRAGAAALTGEADEERAVNLRLRSLDSAVLAAGVAAGAGWSSTFWRNVGLVHSAVSKAW